MIELDEFLDRMQNGGWEMVMTYFVVCGFIIALVIILFAIF